MSFKASIQAAWRKDRVPFYLIGVAGLVLIIFTFSRHRLTTNPRSRIITVERALDAGTLAHKSPTDSTEYELSMDMVKVGDNFYSSKPPLYPFIMIVQGYPLSKILPGTFRDHDRTYVRWFTLLNQVFPYILMLVIALFLVNYFTDDRWTRIFIMAALSLGSLAYGYAVTINNHTPAAVIWMLALYLVVRIYKEEDYSWGIFAVLGLLCGMGAMIDLTSAIFGLLFLGTAILKNPKAIGVSKIALTLGLAGVPVLITAWGYYQMSGSPVPFYLRSGLYHYEGSPWDNRQGIDALKEPRWLYLFNSLFTHHGVFSLSPVLMLGVIGMFFGKKRKAVLPAWYFPALGICMLLVVALITGTTRNYGGYCVGMRWYIPFMPLLMLAGIPVIEAMGKKMWTRIFALLLLILSILPNLEILYWEAFIQSSLEKWLFPV